MGKSGLLILWTRSLRSVARRSLRRRRSRMLPKTRPVARRRNRPLSTRLKRGRCDLRSFSGGCSGRAGYNMGGSILRCISVLHSGSSFVWMTGGRGRSVGCIDFVRSNTISGDSAANYDPLETRYCIGVTPVCIAVVTASALPRLEHARPPQMACICIGQLAFKDKTYTAA